MRSTFALLLISTLALGCDPDEGTEDAGPGEVDAGPPEMEDAGFDGGFDAGFDAGIQCEGPPGLYEEGDCTVIAAGVRSYTPRFELWADGASKERYIMIPDGTQIDTADPDNWVYPVGTTFYKTFLLDGVRLETRILQKMRDGVGVAAWDVRVYAWNMAQDAVTDVTNSAEPERMNVLGTNHDIPSGADCIRCHIGQNGHDMINGFSAFQMNHDDAGVNYPTLVSEGRIANPFVRSDAEVPGDADDVATLGWLHTNCGYCHRPGGDPAAALRGFYLRLQVGLSDTVEATTPYATGVNVPSTITFGDAICRFMPGNSTNSVAIHRMTSREAGVQMPPLATEQVPADAETMVRAWVDGLGVAADAACSP